jgi:hypothetical protein
MGGRLHLKAPSVLAAIVFTLVATSAPLRAQVPAAVKMDVRTARGQIVSPVYEGWYRLGDTTYALFGYYNRNLEEIVEIPIGPANKLEPGPHDQNQPTRFYPGRHYGVFGIAVPADRSGMEVTWTLTNRGQTLSIPAFIDQQYVVHPQQEQGGMYPGNTPPVVKLEAGGPSAQGPLGTTVRRSAKVSQPLTLDAWVTDDGLPPPPREAPAPGGRPAPGSAISPRVQGLTVTWRIYRGPGDATIANPTPRVEQGKAQTQVTFRQPGEYILHVLAIDARAGSMCCWTNGYVRVSVDGATAAHKSNGAKP